jgi:hypothetical protein
LSAYVEGDRSLSSAEQRREEERSPIYVADGSGSVFIARERRGKSFARAGEDQLARDVGRRRRIFAIATPHRARIYPHAATLDSNLG